jgi:hypothetical protein
MKRDPPTPAQPAAVGFFMSLFLVLWQSWALALQAVQIAAAVFLDMHRMGALSGDFPVPQGSPLSIL